MKTLISILFLLLLAAAAAPTALSQPTSFAFDFYGDQPSELTYQGTAHFPPPSQSTYLRLTDAIPSSAGRALYSTPIAFWENEQEVDFETTITFIITPTSDTPADGIAFFIAPKGSTIPDRGNSNGGNLGIFGSDGTSPYVFAVEFDTYVNEEWDPIFRHIGIDIGSRESKQILKVGDAIIGNQVTARINYEGNTHTITVHVALPGSEPLEVKYEFNLRDYLADEVQVGLSASTGGDVAIHDIVSWYFSSTTAGAASSRKELGWPKLQQVV